MSVEFSKIPINGVTFYLPNLQYPLESITEALVIIAKRAFQQNRHQFEMEWSKQKCSAKATTVFQRNARICVILELSLFNHKRSVSLLKYSSIFEKAIPEQSEMIEDEVIIPKKIMVQNTLFILSYELRKGLYGHRAEDHRVKVDILKLALEKNIRRIRRNKYKEAFDLYVRIFSKHDSFKILNLFIKGRPSPLNPTERELTIITAYYMPPHSFKGRFDQSQTEFEHCINDFPLIFLP